ncbi:iron chelate uptake ABC transporter family permease subunit [Erwiniaceae bacterium BAC15a-03b]|uniref:Iron chelate uptake ABC transporter family permease subunit n=1 Tax=Winslowiella arboricola TaxID=2978220 RepID=A0A9J6PR63_9GAMM|nr:iron chelate uptake ABC transporter family permease subunit [Winslowiella arboricola]MCU5773328.1 iron chelate uptake ABC transporter family permease subunit [Winslowiella arboricola]MCU5779214.1 iron chelate uptake ABC transporter family permease subunit [Winslowiella arboricola]
MQANPLSSEQTAAAGAGLSRPARRLLLLAALALLAITLFMTINLHGNIAYILVHRGLILATMLLVAVASGVATLLFQTVTNNRILTPSVMGLEALFILIQTTMIFFIDADGLRVLGISGKFICESLLLVLFSLLLYRWLLSSSGVNLHQVLLVGLVCGTLFRSLSNLLQRLLSPGEFAVLQGRIFATFTRAAPEIIALAAAIVLLVAVVIWRMRFTLDVLALGRNSAINLGVPYQQKVMIILLLVSVLVAVSTALVGPLTFLGLLVANLSYQLIGSHRHRYLLPGVVLTGVIALVGGQLILERIFNMAGTLSVVIEFTGGALFLYLLLKKASL